MSSKESSIGGSSTSCKPDHVVAYFLQRNQTTEEFRRASDALDERSRKAGFNPSDYENRLDDLLSDLETAGEADLAKDIIELYKGCRRDGVPGMITGTVTMDFGSDFAENLKRRSKKGNLFG